MSALIGLALIATYVYLVKYRSGGGKGKGEGKLPWWMHISILGGASCTLANSVIGTGLVALINTVLGFLAGLLSGILELVSKQPIAFGTSVVAGIVGAFLLLVLIVDVRDKVANKPALVATILLPFLFMTAAGGLAGQGQDFTSQVAEFSESAGRAIVGG